jgi:hypothetical protein
MGAGPPNTEPNFAIKASVVREVLPVFQASTSPKISDREVQAVVGCQVRAEVRVPGAVRNSGRNAPPSIHSGRGFEGTCSGREKELQAWSVCPWQQFPPADLPGKSDFKEQVGWTVRFRNTEGHLAPDLDDARESKLVQSVCVCFVWLTCKFQKEIQSALLAARFSDYLRGVRDSADFNDIRSRYVELLAEARAAEEYRFLDPLASVPDAPAAGDTVKASKLPDANRITVIEAGPGAGKTTTLQILAWRHVEKLLSGGNSG